MSANAVNRVLFSTAEQTAELNSEALSVDSLTGYNSSYRSPTHTHIQCNSIIAPSQTIYLEAAHRIPICRSILSGPVCPTRNVYSPTEVDRSDRCRYEATQHRTTTATVALPELETMRFLRKLHETDCALTMGCHSPGTAGGRIRGAKARSVGTRHRLPAFGFPRQCRPSAHGLHLP